MPIRFRCAYCSQLMGIARRKAGTVVRCPKCAGQVVVPAPEGNDEQANEPEPEPGPAPKQTGNGQQEGGGLFEESDFEKVFDPEVPKPRQPAVPVQQRHAPAPTRPQPAAAPKVAAELEYDAVPLPTLGPPPRGIYLTPAVLALLCGLVVVLMGMAFFLGLLLGRS